MIKTELIVNFTVGGEEMFGEAKLHVKENDL